MKTNYLFIPIALLLFSASCKKKAMIVGNNDDTKNINSPLPHKDTTIQKLDIVQKFNILPLKEKIKLYNKMIVDNQPTILAFFREKGMAVLLKKFVTNSAPWTKDIDNFTNIPKKENHGNESLFIGRIPLYGISEKKYGSTDAKIQYVNFFSNNNNHSIKSDVRFISFYAWQEDDIDILEVKNIDPSSFYVYFHFKNNQGATILVQDNLGLSQHTIENPFTFDSDLLPNINDAIEKMIKSVP